MPYKYTNDTRNMLEGYFNGKEPLERKKPAFGESKNYFIDPNDSTQTIEVPDGTDPYAFRDAGYKTPSLTDIGSGLTTETGTGLNTSLTNNSSTSLTDQTGIGNNSLNTSTGLLGNKTSSNTPSLFGSTKTNTDNPWAGLGDDTTTSVTTNPWAGLGDGTASSKKTNPWAGLGNDTTSSTTTNPWAALGDDTTTSVTSNPWAGLGDINDTNTLRSGLFNNSNNMLSWQKGFDMPQVGTSIWGKPNNAYTPLSTPSLRTRNLSIPSQALLGNRHFSSPFSKENEMSLIDNYFNSTSNTTNPFTINQENTISQETQENTENNVVLPQSTSWSLFPNAWATAVKAKKKIQPLIKPTYPRIALEGDDFFSPEQTNFIVETETKNKYNTLNKAAGGLGAMGKYQARQDILKEIGYLSKKNGRWLGKDSINSRSDFLKNEAVQDKAFNLMVKKYNDQLKNANSYGYLNKSVIGALKNEAIPLHKGNLICAAHRRGATKVKRYLDKLSTNVDNNFYMDYGKLNSEDDDAFRQIETRLRECYERLTLEDKKKLKEIYKE